MPPPPDSSEDIVAQLQGDLDAAAVKIASLERALESSRVIGAATGIIMITRKLVYDEAFDVLRRGSQVTNRKTRDLAENIVLTGYVPDYDQQKS